MIHFVLVCTYIGDSNTTQCLVYLHTIRSAWRISKFFGSSRSVTMSLSEQLKQINENTASVALDRKARSKIHSKSLIFGPKIAGTQDYDYLHLVGIDGLTELCTIDPRFAKFEQTLFAESTINFDRNVQTKEIIENLDASITAFLNLVGPLYPLSPAVKAVEWLVRRFYINIHNSEALLLTCLPHYQLQVFARVMNVIPKSLWPPIFSWLNGYRDMAKNPPDTSIVKAFRNDYQLFKIYSDYVLEQVRVGTVYKEQLVFYLTNTIQILASFSTDTEKLNEVYLPVVMEVVGRFLLALNSTLDYELTIAAYTLISVTVSMVPLEDKISISLMKSVVQLPGALSSLLMRQTTIILAQIFQHYTGYEFKFDFLPPVLVEEMLEANILPSLVEEGFDLNNIILSLIASSTDRRLLAFAEFFNIKTASEPSFATFVTNLLDIIASEPSGEDRSLIVSAFEKMLNDSPTLLTEHLSSRNPALLISDLEMLLLTTLSTTSESVDDEMPEAEEVQIPDEITSSESVSLEGTKSATASFLSQDSKDFEGMSSLLVSFLASLDAAAYSNLVGRFCSSIFSGPVASITFVLRCSLTPRIPIKVRTACLIHIKRKLKELSNKGTGFHLILPILLLGLYDEHQVIRTGFAECFHSIVSQAAKAEVFMETELYENVPSMARVVISPKDGDHLVDQFVSSRSILEEVVMDRNRLIPMLFDGIFKVQNPSKKFGLVCQTFFIGQWSQLPFSLVFKSLIFKIVSARNLTSAVPSRESFIKNDINAFFSQVKKWEVSAHESKLDFTEDIVCPLVGLLGSTAESATKELENDDLNFLLKALDFSDSPELQIAAKDRLVEVVGSFRPENKLRAFAKLVDLQASDKDLEFDAQEALQEMSLDFATCASLLKNYQLVSQIPEQQIPKRRRRSSNSSKQNMAQEGLVAIASTHLKKLTIVLDLLEFNLRGHLKGIQPEILLSFFGILTDLEYLGHDGDMPVLYTQEVLASCMLMAVKLIKSGAESDDGSVVVDSNSVRADLIVNTIRSSKSPQIQNRLLLVVAELASLAPEIILHSVMPIFTFMGAHTIRQDDEFSSYALQDTIAKVVPALAHSGASSFNSEIEFLLTSFVTAFPHIPRHRRVKLFTTLSVTLGPENSIHTVLFLLAVQYAALAAKGKYGECVSLLEFTRSYLRQFLASEQLSAIHRFCSLWKMVPTKVLEQDSEEFKILNARPVFGSSILALTASELADLRVQMLAYIDGLMQSGEGTMSYLQLKIDQLLLDSHTAEDEKASIVQGCKEIASLILGSLDDTRSHSTKIAGSLYRLLDDVLSLLPMTYFLDSIIDVLKKPSSTDRVAINFARLAGNKIETEMSPANLDERVQASILNVLLPVLVTGIEAAPTPEICQAYIDALSQALGKLESSSPCFTEAKNVSKLNECLAILVAESGLKSDNPECIISSMNCISTIVNILGVRAIGFFPKIFEPSVSVWKRTQPEGAELLLVQTSVLLLFAQLVKKLPAFVTTKLDDIFTCTLKSFAVDASVRSTILSSTVDHVDSAYVLKSLCNVWNTISESDDAEVIGLYMSAMERTIGSLDKKSAIAQATLFTRWTIKVFEFRLSTSENPNQEFDTNTIHRLESSFHSCALTYVMKLNDKTFRPLFAGLVRWAVSGEGSTTSIDEVSRYVAFFRFFIKIQEQLKSIVTSYYSYLIDPVSNLLLRIDTIDDHVNLKRMVLNSLTSAFKHDQDDFWSQQLRFDSICGPLLQQIPTIEDSIGKYLVKSITAFVVNVASDEHNEQLVHGLIRHISNEHSTSNSHSKIWTIRILKHVFQKMGDQWLSYLPTLIPYIAELLEDDDEEVELEVRRGLVKVIENVLGEPLDRYLS